MALLYLLGTCVVALAAASPTPLRPVKAEETELGQKAAARLFSAQLERADALAAVGAMSMPSSVLSSPGIGWEVADEGNHRRDTRGIRAVAALMRMLHVQQHPPRAACSSSRLLVVHFEPDSFEGAGSVFKVVMVGLAEAAYSNRTLVWGADLTMSMELTKDAWMPTEDGEDAHPTVHGLLLHCRSKGGGGSLGCFVEPLSSCSLADASWEELQELGRSGHNRSSRLKIMEGRRVSPAAYRFPPLGKGTPWSALQGGGSAASSSSSAALPSRHVLWAAALAAYTFRPQPHVAAAFERTRHSLRWSPDTACMHVRHGDVKALDSVYANRVWFGFGDYFDALRRMSSQGGVVGGLPPPAAVFVASDSMHIGEALNAELARAKRWGGESATMPRFFAVNQSRRFLAPHGSHTVASEGACRHGRSGSVCSLPWEIIEDYKRERKAAEAAGGGVTQATRLMDVLYESLEDLYLLAHCTRMVTTACSHFSTFATMLGWAGTGGASAGAATAFLDSARVADGELSSMFLHGMVNATNRAVPGRSRWQSLTSRFPGGVWDEDILGSLLTGPATALLHQDEVTATPVMPDEAFWPEVQHWVGGEGQDGKRGSYPQACPLRRDAGDSDVTYVGHMVNTGAVQSQLLHFDQAMLCWQAAEEIVLQRQKAGGGGDSTITPALVVDYLDVIQGNMKYVQSHEFATYSAAPAVLARRLQESLIVPPGGSSAGSDPYARLRLPRLPGDGVGRVVQLIV